MIGFFDEHLRVSTVTADRRSRDRPNAAALSARRDRGSHRARLARGPRVALRRRELPAAASRHVGGGSPHERAPPRRDPRRGWRHIPAAPCRRSRSHGDDVRSTRDRDRLPRCVLPAGRIRIGSALQRSVGNRGRSGPARDRACGALARKTDRWKPSTTVRPSHGHGAPGHARCRRNGRLRRLPDRLRLRLHAHRPHWSRRRSSGSRSRRSTVPTSDGLDLAARYVPARNRAAIVVFPGSSAVTEARMIASHGYGVLLLDPRGQGGSEGDLVRWAGDRDLVAGGDVPPGSPRRRPGSDRRVRLLGRRRDPARRRSRVHGFHGGRLRGSRRSRSATRSSGSRGRALCAGEPRDASCGDRVLQPCPAARASSTASARSRHACLPDLHRARNGRRGRQAAGVLRRARAAEEDLEGARSRAHRRHRGSPGASTSSE